MKCMVDYEGAKVFTTLDLKSEYYHIGLSENSKAKTVFVTPFGKYQFRSSAFWFSTSSGLFSTVNFYSFTGMQ